MSNRPKSTWTATTDPLDGIPLLAPIRSDQHGVMQACPHRRARTSSSWANGTHRAEWFTEFASGRTETVTCTWRTQREECFCGERVVVADDTCIPVRIDHVYAHEPMPEGFRIWLQFTPLAVAEPKFDPWTIDASGDGVTLEFLTAAELDDMDNRSVSRWEVFLLAMLLAARRPLGAFKAELLRDLATKPNPRQDVYREFLAWLTSWIEDHPHWLAECTEEHREHLLRCLKHRARRDEEAMMDVVHARYFGSDE